MKTFFSKIVELRVRYSETDQMGYCYYGNYAQYFEVGRVEALRGVGMSYKSLEEQGYMLPVSTMDVQYKAPAKYDDLLKIETRITEMKGARLIFNYTIRIEDRVIATGNTTLVFVLKDDMRPTQPPADFTQLLSKYEEI
ncbi:MAG: acyl-CoA thioester hydrolase [Vicingaceae bacterium]|jgi:acyl-CoA thioester hydrolase